MSQLLFRFLGLSLSLTLSLPSTTKYETLKTATTTWPSSNEDRWWDLHKKEGKSGVWRRTQDWNGNGETYKRERSSSSDDEPPICKNGLGFVETRSSSSSSCCCCCNNCENSQGLGFSGVHFACDGRRRTPPFLSSYKSRTVDLMVCCCLLLLPLQGFDKIW